MRTILGLHLLGLGPQSFHALRARVHAHTHTHSVIDKGQGFLFPPGAKYMLSF